MQNGHGKLRDECLNVVSLFENLPDARWKIAACQRGFMTGSIADS